MLFYFDFDPTTLQTPSHVDSKNYFPDLQVDSVSYKETSEPNHLNTEISKIFLLFDTISSCESFYAITTHFKKRRNL